MNLVVTSALAHSVTAVFERVSVKLEKWNFDSMCVSKAAFRKHSLEVKGQVSRWGQGKKTAKNWQIWTLSINCIWQGRALFDTCDSDVHQHVLYQMRPHSTRYDEESLSYDPMKIGQKSFFGTLFNLKIE